MLIDLESLISVLRVEIGNAGEEHFVGALELCVRRAVLGAVGATWTHSPFGASRRPDFESCFFGMTGGPEDKARLIGEMIRSRRIEVTHDAVTALMGATEGRPGIIVIAGTGSICFGMNARGETARSGGWGYVFGDEGSSTASSRPRCRSRRRRS